MNLCYVLETFFSLYGIQCVMNNHLLNLGEITNI